MRTHSRKLANSRPAFLKAKRSAGIKNSQLAALRFYLTNQASLSGLELVRLTQEVSTKSRKNKNQSLLVLSNNQLVGFSTDNKYLVHPEQIWLIESIVGIEVFRKALSNEKGEIINDQFIEKLFSKATFAFYLSADKAYLVSSDDELAQLDFGPLTKVSALEALQRFGLVALEQAKEKTVVRL